jgi:hypothetical protein
MIYKVTSVRRVIAKVFTDLDLKEGDHRISDLIEWAGEAIKKIGAFPTLLTKVTGKGGLPLLEISNYQVKLPCDLVAINQVAYSTSESGPFYPMVYATGSFDATAPTEAENTALTNVPTDNQLINLVRDLYGADFTVPYSYSEAALYLNTHPTVRESLEGLLTGQRSNNGTRDAYTASGDYTYLVFPGYIKTALKDGYLMVSYQAVPVDNEGYPMIPDDESFEEAIYWYINMKLTYPEWKMGRIRDAVYYDTRNSWNFYRKQAYGHSMMPNVDQLEAIKNAWLRLVPEINEHGNAFTTLNERQIIYNKNK